MGLKIKADYPNSRELKLHPANDSVTKLLLTVRIRGKLPVRQGDKVATFEVGQTIGQPTTTPITTDKTNVKALTRNIVCFQIGHLFFSPLVDHYLVVARYGDRPV